MWPWLYYSDGAGGTRLASVRRYCGGVFLGTGVFCDRYVCLLHSPVEISTTGPVRTPHHLLPRVIVSILGLVNCQSKMTTKTTNFIKSMTPERCGSNFKSVIYENILRVSFMSTFEIDRIWMSQNIFDDKTALVQVMVWCRQAINPLPETMLIHIHVTIWRH